MPRAGREELRRLFELLLNRYGPQRWWPVDLNYHREHGTDPREEVVIGAVLTQNASWRNAEKALNNLKKLKALSFKGIRELPYGELLEAVRPAGSYRRKAGYLKELTGRFGSAEELSRLSRGELLKLKGFGKETADAVLLYAFNRPYFVVDAYAKRLLKRLYGLEGSYDEIQRLFHESLPRDAELFKEYHALIDEHGKRHCRKRPRCEGCPLERLCGFKDQSRAQSA
ncbi:MAG: endonuclease III domain-containing protein [Aquificae bacterium]|nr:endonuclease III domain-containing protein [Aquificota bacterium]